MSQLKISFVGDLLPADTHYNIGRGIGSKMPAITDYYSDKENIPFLNSDLVFCNLEAPLIYDPEGKDLPFSGNPEVIKLLKLLRISVVSVANNRTSQICI